MASKKKVQQVADGSWGNGTIDQRGQRWRIRWRENGERRATSAGSEAEARDELVRIQGRLADGKPGIEPLAPVVPIRKGLGDTGFDRLVEDWVEHRRKFDVRTADEEIARWKLHLAGPLSTMTVRSVSAKWVRELAGELVKPTIGTKAPDGTAKRPVSGPTAHRVLTLLSAFYSWLVREEVVTVNPAALALTDKDLKKLLAPKSTKVKVKVPLRSWDEVSALQAALTGSVAAWYLLQARCGLRPGEATGQRWSDVDLEGGKLLVRGQVRHGHYDVTKGGDPRTVPLVPVVVDALKAWRTSCPGELVCPPPVRVRKDGKPGSPMGTYLASKSTSKALAVAFKATRIKPRTPYEAGRVTYGTLVGGSGKVSAFTLQRWMGHADVKTTESYVKQQEGLSAGELAALGG